MKNKYNWAQVADIYCQELGVDFPEMEEYLKGIYSDIPSERLYEYQMRLQNKLKNMNNRSEYFPDLYID